MKRGWLSFYFLSKAPRPVRIPTHKLWVFEKINILYFLNFLLWNHTHSRRHIKRKRIVWRITANTRIAITAVKIRTGIIPGGPLHPAVLPALGPPRAGAPRGRTRRSLPFPVYSLVATRASLDAVFPFAYFRASRKRNPAPVPPLPPPFPQQRAFWTSPRSPGRRLCVSVPRSLSG